MLAVLRMLQSLTRASRAFDTQGTHARSTSSNSVVSTLIALLLPPAHSCSRHQLWPTPAAFTLG